MPKIIDAKYHRDRYWRNREKILVRQKQWRKENPLSEKQKQKVRDRAARWYVEHPERAKETARRWEKANPQKVKASRLRRRKSILAGQRKCYRARRKYYIGESMKWAKSNPDRRREIGRNWAKNSNLKKLKLSKSDYLKMFDDQNNCCAICQKEFAGKVKACLDHDHKTGKVRALLCHCCNAGLGMFKDTEALLEAAKTYLRRFK